MDNCQQSRTCLMQFLSVLDAVPYFRLLLFLVISFHGDYEASAQVTQSFELIQETVKDMPEKTQLILDEYRRSFHEWDRVVRGFRREHHFSILVGTGKTYTKGHVIFDRTSYPFDWGARSLDIEMEYAFHLPLYRNLGYFVGTRFGMVDALNYGRSTRKALYIMKLPGLRAGMVWNVSSAWRVGLGGQFSLLRFGDIKPVAALANRLSLTGAGGAVDVGVDWFLTLNHGIRFEYQYYRWNYRYEDSISLKRMGHSVSFGLVNHLI